MKLLACIGLAALLALGLGACRPAPKSVGRSGQLYVGSDPSGAMLLLDGVNVGQAPATLADVAPGEHLLVWRKENYRERRQTVTVRPGERLTVEGRLEPVAGLVLIHSKPNGVDVELGEASVGKTPLFLTDFPLGQRSVRFSVPGYLPRVVNVNVPDRTPQKLFVELVSDSARLQINSAPTGAVILLNGTAVGRTPRDLASVPSGKHTLEITLDGYAPYRSELVLVAGDRRTINPPLIALPGSLQVLSVPAGARVYLNGEFRAETPFAAEVPAGTYVVRGELRGYDPQEQTNRVVFNRETTVEFTLVKSSGIILVTTEPPGVSVFLDGELRGVTQAKNQGRISEQLQIDFVPQGQRIMQLTAPGYFDVTLTNQITPQQPVLVHERMRPRPVLFVPNVILRTGAGVEHTYKGIIRERYANGSVKLELEPGVFRIFSKNEIISADPITNVFQPARP